VKLYGPHATWREVGQCLLDSPNRTSREGRMLPGSAAIKRAFRKQVVEVRRQVTVVRDFVVSRSEVLELVFFGGAMPR
jgi:hypothetical protein